MPDLGDVSAVTDFADMLSLPQDAGESEASEDRESDHSDLRKQSGIHRQVSHWPTDT